MLLKFCFLLAFVPSFIQSLDPTLNDDVLGLIFFKAGLEDPEGKLTSWNEDDESPCSWVGVKCDPRTNRVIQLTLDGLSLSGHIGRGLSRLQSLQVLSLSKNNLTGTINPDLSHFGTLHVMDFGENNLSGSVPDELFKQCGTLRVVSFANNNLNGQLPDSLSYCPNLVSVNFSSNQLSGRLPAGIWYLRSLQSLDLSDNLLEGDVVDGIANLYDLRALNLGKNRFSGPLPDDIGGCSLLKVVDFSENSLSGSLPDSLQRLNSCASLYLHGNSFTGEVPEWIGKLGNLENLDLSENFFSGRIPFSLGNLHLLKELNVSMNQFTGGLPESLTNCVNLLAIDISQNNLTGNLPLWIFKMGLQRLSLSGNRLGGRMDYASFSSINQGLEVLDLSSNVLSGEIPSNIGVLSSLRLLNMSRNHLIGSIPASVGALKATQILDLSNNWLHGSIPSEIGGAISLKELRLEKNYLSGKIPVQIENCSSLTSLDGSDHFIFFLIPTVLNAVLYPREYGLSSVSMILSHNNLSGSIPAAIANLSNLQYVDLSFNNLTGSLPKELTNLSRLVSFNISHNHFLGELPVGGFFNTISATSVSGNPSLCGSVVNHSCPSNHPKPIVLNPNSSDSSHGGSSQNHRRKIVLSISALIAIGAAAFIAIGVVAVTVLNIHVRSSMSRAAAALMLSGEEDYSCSPTKDPNYGKLVMFSGDAEFAAGANGLLNKDCELGRGGFGVVYQTTLGDGRSVAIKKLTVSGLIKSQEDFEREMKKLGKIRHHNLVTLEGYYWTPSLQLLIYEFIAGGTLEDGRVEECVDGRLGGNFPPDEAIPVIKLGLICASQVPSNRPDMEEVVNILELIQCPLEGQQEELE
ncbi:hypothetical protein Patl1_31553 [Pistacia atlantica]|uniref:Uncharacterized protein n=1 Tax=Pistacia atlantica TaxID=434234 RepID=A0ACC1AN69_9ROSI|nr:hypothetical protein Patl1_31553 [Pistacia atlantica]